MRLPPVSHAEFDRTVATLCPRSVQAREVLLLADAALHSHGPCVLVCHLSVVISRSEALIPGLAQPQAVVRPDH
jgi:hypothetical protein